MAPETRNGGTSTFNNNNNGVDNSKKKVLIVLDIFCLLLGKFIGRCWHKKNPTTFVLFVSVLT